jgi:hypothetical protein
MTDYKATPEQWAQCEDWVRSSVVGASDACILELRARVEALEAGLKDEADCNRACIFNLVDRLRALELKSKATSNDRPIRSSLVERVQSTISDIEFPHGNDEARAAIREVAAWIEENKHEHWSAVSRMLRAELEQEAK